MKMLAPFLSVTKALAESIFEAQFCVKGWARHASQWRATVWETADVEGSLRGDPNTCFYYFALRW